MTVCAGKTAAEGDTIPGSCGFLFYSAERIRMELCENNFH